MGGSGGEGPYLLDRVTLLVRIVFCPFKYTDRASHRAYFARFFVITRSLFSLFHCEQFERNDQEGDSLSTLFWRCVKYKSR